MSTSDKKTRVDEILDQLKSCSSSIEELEQSLSSEKTQREELQQKITEIKGYHDYTVRQFRGQTKTLHEEKKKLSAQLEQRNQKLQQASEYISKVRSQLSVYQNENKQLKSTLERLQSENAQSSEQKRSLSDLLDVEKKIRLQKEDELRFLNEKFNEAEKQISDLQNRLGALRRDQTDRETALKHRSQAAQNQITKLRQENMTLSEGKAKAEEYAREYYRLFSEAVKQKQTLEAQAGEERRAIEEIQKLSEQSNSELQHTQKNYEERIRKLEHRAETDRASLKQAALQARRDLDRSLEENRKLRDELSALKSQIAEKERENLAAQVTTEEKPKEVARSEKEPETQAAMEVSGSDHSRGFLSKLLHRKAAQEEEPEVQEPVESASETEVLPPPPNETMKRFYASQENKRAEESKAKESRTRIIEEAEQKLPKRRPEGREESAEPGRKRPPTPPDFMKSKDF